MAQYDSTKFVNIDKEDFTGYYDRAKNPNGYTIKAGEERQLVSFVAETLAKHLVDKILQGQGVKDSMRDTPLRRDMFARILPDLQKREDVKVLSTEDRLKALEEELDRVKKQNLALGGVEEKKKGGRPKKIESKVDETTQ